jgi:hypothetical protein
MCAHQYNQAKYPLRQVVNSFGNLLFELAEQHLTHTYAVVFCFWQLKSIDYPVLRYLNTGL